MEYGWIDPNKLKWDYLKKKCNDVLKDVETLMKHGSGQ